MQEEQTRIISLVCKFERIFPPSFFDIMIHLLIHLPYEAMVAGPPQYRWMFPFERKMGTLKGYVHNKAKPEGCIGERYIDNESLTFCSMYLNNVETVFNRVERNNEQKDNCSQLSVFSCKARPLGGTKFPDIDSAELAKIHSYILNNCDELEDLIVQHKMKLEEESVDSVTERHNMQFASWLDRVVQNNPYLYSCDVRYLAHGPLSRVVRYNGCMVNGYRFHTQSRELDRKTQNSGVVVQGEHGNNLIDFYGLLQDVLEVEYIGSNKRVILFKCEWIRVDAIGCQIDKESGLTSVNLSRRWYNEQPYILASQARQVYYVSDLKLGSNWHIV